MNPSSGGRAFLPGKIPPNPPGVQGPGVLHCSCLCQSHAVHREWDSEAGKHCHCWRGLGGLQAGAVPLLPCASLCTEVGLFAQPQPGSALEAPGAVPSNWELLWPPLFSLLFAFLYSPALPERLSRCPSSPGHAVATVKVQAPVSIFTRFSVATGLLFQQASLGILNSNAHFNALKRLPPWSLCPPLPLLFTCYLALEETLDAFSKLFRFKPWANPPPTQCQAALLFCKVLYSITGKTSPSSVYLSGTLSFGGQQPPIFYPCIQFSIPALRIIFF